jgi:hypothetical protein
MPLALHDLRLNLDEPEEELLIRAAERLRVPRETIRAYALVHRAVDARHKDDIHFSCTLEIALDLSPRQERNLSLKFRPPKVAWIEPHPPADPSPGNAPLPGPVVIIGFGPAGMFAALRLARRGYRPIILERGRDVRRRHRDVMQRFYREHVFDPESNLLYGEGGAGAYSDGKLHTRLNDPLTRHVLAEFVHHGADPDIFVNARPHIGSDRIPAICMRIRQHIESLGGSVLFEHTFDDLRIRDGVVTHVRVRYPTRPDGEWIATGLLLLAAGHSARDTLHMLARHGLTIEPKPFQIGVRIEHAQALVDRWQFRELAGHPKLGAAEYHWASPNSMGPCGNMFTFCMCPGGVILPTNESPGLIATNGASRANRAGEFANSGLVITMTPQYLGTDAIGGVAYQRRWEQLAFEATGGTYRVPAQRVSDFLAGKTSDGELRTSFPMGASWVDIVRVVPREVTETLRSALPSFEARFPGFTSDEAIITAPETRVSAPFRLLRDKETRRAAGIENLYPIGEGAGYAGGIISAAIDGIHSADRIIGSFAPPS